jgi:hypothetical protein
VTPRNLNDNNVYFYDDLAISIFITLPKTSGAIECEDNHTISILSSITNILLRIIMSRVSSKLRPEVGVEQTRTEQEKE